MISQFIYFLDAALTKRKFVELFLILKRKTAFIHSYLSVDTNYKGMVIELLDWVHFLKLAYRSFVRIMSVAGTSLFWKFETNILVVLCSRLNLNNNYRLYILP